MSNHRPTDSSALLGAPPTVPCVRRAWHLLIWSVVADQAAAIAAFWVHDYSVEQRVGVTLISLGLLTWGWWRQRPVLWILLITGISASLLQFVPPVELGAVLLVAPPSAIKSWLAYLGLREWHAARRRDPTGS